MNRQPDLFLSDAQPQSWEDFPPPRTYGADPVKVRAELHQLLELVRTADEMPWPPKRLLHFRTIFPQMSRWLPDEEAGELCRAFAVELERLESA